MLHHLWRFFGGIFLINIVPHLSYGVSGHAFQSPFATPPGQGLSSPMVNVCWGLLILVIAYGLIIKATPFNLRSSTHVAPVFAGMLLGGLLCAYSFGAIYAQN
jgi:hypothetical protein